jgi:hypothetical protein
VIRTRRLIHRQIFLLLAFLVPALLFVGLAFRPEVPPLAKPDLTLLSKAGFVPNMPDNLTRIQAGEHTFEIAIEADSSTTSSLLIRSVDPLLKPDLLVYWVGESIQNNSLPENALLLGELMGTSFRHMTFPTAPSTQPGSLVIYSLAHQEVFTQFSLPSAVETRIGAQSS